MRGIQDYLKELDSESVDISDSHSYEPLLLKINPFKAKPDPSEAEAEAVLFFKMIFSCENFHNLDKKQLISVYHKSDSIHRAQLISRISTNALNALGVAKIFGNYQDVAESLKPVIDYTSRLLKNGGLSFEKSLDIFVTSVKFADDPKDMTTLTHLNDLANQYSLGFFGKLGAYIQKAVGIAFNALGHSHGKEMVASANAKLNLKPSIFAARLTAVQAKEVPESNPADDEAVHLDSPF